MWLVIHLEIQREASSEERGKSPDDVVQCMPPGHMYLMLGSMAFYDVLKRAVPSEMEMESFKNHIREKYMADQGEMVLIRGNTHRDKGKS